MDTEGQKMFDLQWDEAGNLGRINQMDYDGTWQGSRHLFWTEDKRLHTAIDENYYSYYAYAPSGERVLKLVGKNTELDVNASYQLTGANLETPTLYPSPYIVMDIHGYTKHYYAGEERVCAKIGAGFETTIADNNLDLQAATKGLFDDCQASIAQRELSTNNESCIISLGDVTSQELQVEIKEMPTVLQAGSNIYLSNFHQVVALLEEKTQGGEETFYYHGDHLGSANWITDASGHPIQHLQYLPFGERYIDQRVAGSTYQERFRFTGKERDEETGYGYFGARYMDHELMTSFFSVDRYADKYPFVSPYAYCAWNPVRLTDPSGDTIVISNKSERIVYQAGMSYNGNDSFIGKTIGYLNDMSETDEGRVVIDKLIESSKSYTYTSLIPSKGKAAFNDKTLNFEMGNAVSNDYAHETFHAYQYDYGMRGKTATREVGARLFEAIMCDKILQWGFLNPTTPLKGTGSTYTESIMHLFLWGFDAENYSNACNLFLDQSMAGPEYKSLLGYSTGQILADPPIRKILNINQSSLKNQ